VHEDELSSCPFVMKLFGTSKAFVSPIVASGATGQLQARVRCVVSVLAYCPGGQVAERCSSSSSGQSSSPVVELDNDSVVRWTRDCAAGLRAMHAKGLTHRNLNPRNVHVDARGRAVLTGFQLLKNPRAPGDLYSLGRADCGTYSCVSPEVDDGSAPVGPAADVWALGCVLLAWVCGDPEGGASLARVKELSLEEILRRVPRRFGPKIRSCLRMALQHHPKHRASAADLWKLLSTSKK
jgi:serine/threonine protein kinase